MKQPVNNVLQTTGINQSVTGKIRSLVNDDAKMNFNDKFRAWLSAYTQPAREKIWLDIESYR